MIRFALFLVLAVAAVLAPLVRPVPAAFTDGTFPGWPRSYDGKSLTRVAPAREDAWFARGFPGAIARFSDGDRQIVVRFVNAPTRRLHPAAQCFTAAGYAISPAPMRRSEIGALSSCFEARKGDRGLMVCEQIEGGDGRTWSDVSSWYWAALLGSVSAPWWSYVVVEDVAQRNS